MATLTQPNPTLPPEISSAPAATPQTQPAEAEPAVYWGDWLGVWIWIACAALILAKCTWGWVLSLFE